MFRSAITIHMAILVKRRFPPGSLDASATLICRSFHEKVSRQYFVLNHEHGEDISRFLASYFYPIAPLNIACGSNTCTERPYIKTILVPSGVSVAAKHFNTDVLIGVTLSNIQGRNQNIDVFDYSSVTHPGMKRFCQMMKYVNGVYDVFSDEEVNKALYFRTIAIHPAYYKQGLGKKLAEMSEELGRTKGCQVSAAVAMNPISKRLLSSLGYKSAFRVDCHDLKINGESVSQRTSAS